MKDNQQLFRREENGGIDYFLVFLASLFFLNLYGTFQFVGLALGGYVFFKYLKHALVPDKNTIILLLFGATYVVFSSFNVDFSIRTVYAFVYLPFLAYFAGKVSNARLRSEKSLIVLLLLFSVSVAFIYLFSVLESYMQDDVIGERVTDLRFMSRTEDTMVRAATGVGMHLAPLLAFLPVFLFGNQGIAKRATILGALITVFAAIASALIATRTPIGLVGLLLVFVFLYNIKNQSLFKKLILSLMALSLVYVFTYVDFEAIEITSGIYARFQQDDVGNFGLRLMMWEEGFRNIFLYPWGGEFLRYNFYHNLWLDLRKIGGVVPMIFLLVFSVSSVQLVVAMLANNNISLQLRSLMGAMFIAVFALMFLEPVIEGSMVIFLFYIFLVGFIKQVHYNFSSKTFQQTTPA
ncbi:MAG TPA: hypothetical protein VLH61_07300 [Bacteroidales bacterium]|nr:hypothetical protein [Bacteroidales bacterium]